ncbi:MAG: PepSY-like domain-containing protein [Bacteroidota bacterium]
MKNLLFISLLFLSLTACNRDANDEPAELTDDQLIENMVVSEEAREVEPETLPAEIVEDISRNYFETFLEAVEEVPAQGYIAYLADGNTLYYDTNGRTLEFRGDPDQSSVFRGVHPHGRCFRRLVRFGRLLPATDLSATIETYIADNYPEESIRSAKAIGDTTLVLITGPTILAFDVNDEYIGERNPLEHCTDRCGLVRPTTLATITDYIETNFPNVEVRTTCRRAFRIFVLVSRPDGDRAILMFNLNGDLIGVRF